jgi:hypothetical protein
MIPTSKLQAPASSSVHQAGVAEAPRMAVEKLTGKGLTVTLILKKPRF